MRDVPVPEPGPGQVRVRVEAAGVNFIDVYHRTGLYPVDPPFTPGMEGAGVVDAVGEGVRDPSLGAAVSRTRCSEEATPSITWYPRTRRCPCPKAYRRGRPRRSCCKA